ncbi:hypothetical protein M758_UG122100 [Ceratodon purpureus]|nr:hypothetical protein M758_UG122100 [Ceratodon purpureus]
MRHDASVSAPMSCTNDCFGGAVKSAVPVVVAARVDRDAGQGLTNAKTRVCGTWAGATYSTLPERYVELFFSGKRQRSV